MSSTPLPRLTRKQAAQALGMSTRWLMDSDCPRHEVPWGKSRTKIEYEIPELIRWFTNRQIEKKESVKRSEALEDWRATRAKIAEIELMERRGQVKPIEQFKLMFDIYLEPIKLAMAAIARSYPEAHEIIRVSISRARDQFQREQKEINECPETLH